MSGSRAPLTRPWRRTPRPARRMITATCGLHPVSIRLPRVTTEAGKAGAVRSRPEGTLKEIGVNKTVKRASIILALTPLVSVPVASAAFAATATPTPVTKAVTRTTTTVTTHTDAPGAHASAAAAKVSGVLSIGSSDARADSTGSEAHADSLSLLGTRVFGGDAK